MRHTMQTRSEFLPIVLGLVLCYGCTAQAGGSGDPGKAPAAKPAPVTAGPTPEERARSLIEKQLKALPSDDAALIKTFAKDAVVMLPRVAAKIEPGVELGGQIAGMNPHAEMKSAKLGKL